MAMISNVVTRLGDGGRGFFFLANLSHHFDVWLITQWRS